MTTTHFENVDLLKSLMGGGRPQAPASRRPVPAAATPPPPSAPPPVPDSRPVPDVPETRPAPARTTAAGGPGVKWKEAPPPYQTHAPPAPARGELPGRDVPPPPPAKGAGAGSVRSVSTSSSPALSLASLPGYEAQPSPPPSAPSAAESQATSGLRALFQAPVPLGFREATTPPWPSGEPGRAPALRRQSAPAPSGRGGGSSPGPPALSPVTSVASFRSLAAAGGPGPISELEGDSCLLPRPASYNGVLAGAGPRRLSGPPAPRHAGRSQLFVYKPRQPTAPAPADAPVYELDGEGVAGGGPTRNCRPVEESPRRGGDAREPTAGLGSTEGRPEQKGQPAADVSAGSGQVPVRRPDGESAAWHRRTKMFQA